jgi:hypothetical protein
MMKEDKDSDKVSKLDSEIKGLYQVIMNNKNMVVFNESKQAVDK